ncbi:MAG: sterol desaturase family protein [Flavobacteriaceae bacterium]|nr:sterol desaturase family protein [Flavobacteriaceae bacterium]
MISFLIFLATYLVMECVTWCTHKFVMHGFLWYLHEDHHQPKYVHIFERNDLFFVIFAIPSILLFYFGADAGFDFKFFIGLGIFAYGLSYFIVHDIFIHQRFKLFKNTKNKYLIALRKGHKVHHKHLGKEEGECFGMLFVPFKYFNI